MFDFKIGFLAKFCVIEGISEISYTYKYVCILSVGNFICTLVIPPVMITSGYLHI